MLESPDRSAMELKILQDWVLDKQYRSVPGVADLSSLGGETMEYQVLLDPTKLAGAGLSAGDVATALGANNGNAGGGFYSEGGQFYYVRGLGRLGTLEDIGNVVLTVQNGTPVLVKDVGDVVIGHAPRLGQFGFMTQNDAVEGIVLMRTGEQAQTVLKRVEEKTAELNNGILPADVKVRPFYDRSELVELTTHTVQRQSAARHPARHRRADLLPVRRALRAHRRRGDSARAAVRVHLSRPQAHPGEPALHRRDRLRHPRGRRGGDGGEHLSTALDARRARSRRIDQVIAAAAAEVDRPIVYAVGVIVASFLPIYVLTGPSGRLFTPMADTTIFALIGALIVTLTVIPVLCACCSQASGITSGRTRRSAGCRTAMRAGWTGAWRVRDSSSAVARALVRRCGGSCCAGVGAEFMPKLDEGSALGARDDAVHHLVRRVVEARAADPRRCCARFPR